MAGESTSAIPATTQHPPTTLVAALKPCHVLVAVVVFAVPLAIDPFGLRAFLPAKQAVLLFGAALVALVAAIGFARTAWRVHAPMDQSAVRELPQALHATPAHERQQKDPRVGLWLGGTALALWSWSLVAVTPRALNPELHLGFGWACQSAHLVIFFTAMSGANCARTSGLRHGFELLLGAVAIAALAVACHACLQAANADPLAWIAGQPVQESGRWRIFTTTGNPNWTAEYLAASAPIAVWWASRFTRGALLIWLLFAIAILPTGSRLGLLALSVGAAIDACMRYRVRGKAGTARKWAPAFFTGLIVAASLVWFLRDHGYAATLLRWDDFNSVLGRLRLWQASLHLIAARPFDGYGLDHFARMLPDGLRAVTTTLDPIARSRMPDLLTAHTHDDFLETDVETGIAGGLMLLALFALGLFAVRRALDSVALPAIAESHGESRAPDHTRVATAIPALAASLGVLFLLALASAPLHTPATALLFWVVLGCIAGLAQAAADRPNQACAIPRAWRRGGSVVAICTMLAATGWTGHRAFMLLTGNRQAAAATASAATGPTPETERLYESTLARTPWDHESGVALASLLIMDRRPQAALHVLDRADAWSRSRESWLARAHALLLEHHAEDALEVMERATAAVPDFLRAQMLRARLAARLGKTPEAETARRQVLLSPQHSARAEQIMFEAARELASRAPHR